MTGSSTLYPQTSFILTNRVAGTSFNFKVRAMNKWGYGAYSDPVRIYASEAAAKMNPPTVVVSSINVRISWTLPKSNGAEISEYEILI